MNLREQQSLFCHLVPRLIDYAYTLPGHELAFGEVQRMPAQAQANAASGAGIANSLHLQCLAIDLKLYIDGVYRTDTEAYRPLGEFWEALHPLNRWGGRFAKPDGDHFSSTRDGVR